MKLRTGYLACGLLLTSLLLPASTLQSHPPRVEDRGDFKVSYTPPQNPEYAELQKELKESKLLETIADDLNSSIALPYDVKLRFAECNEPNAFYDPSSHTISICYELLEDVVTNFSKEGLEGDELENAVLGATIFIFYHELGHALIDVLDLPVTGKEEDAVDQLSTFVLADGTDEGEGMALSGARFFYISSKDASDVNDLAFWDEHSLDQQRFYNIICWVYGQNEEKYANLVADGVLPGDRAERCDGEYTQLSKSWTKLLEPYMKGE